MTWFLIAPLAGKAINHIAMFMGGALMLALLIGAPILGILTNPLAPFWFSGKTSMAVGGGPADVPVILPPVGPVAVPTGGVSDVQRYLLAIGAGFLPADAIVATAISIAEDGSGNPAALSPPNFNGTRDLGLWQINSIHWAKFGGQAALTNPVVNAIAAFSIFGPGRNWCAWSTYEASCGAGHNNAYRAFMGRAQAAAQGGH